jgi:glycosyltransferase involved in cell wall biosynthesis
MPRTEAARKTIMKAKVVWLAPYPVPLLAPAIKLAGDPSHFHPASWLVNLSKALAGYQDIELHIVTESTRAPSDQVARQDGITFHVVKSGLPIIHRGFPPYFPVDIITKFAPTVAKLLRKVHELQPDLVHAHGTEGPYALAGVRSQVPCLISVQGIITELFKTDPCFRFRIVRHYEQDCVRHARYFTCRTDFDTQFIRSLNPGARIFTIHEAMNLVYFQKEWRVREEDRLLYVGSLDAHKGLDVLLEAVKLVVQTKPKTMLMVIAGGDQTPYRQLCERLQITGSVQFLGFQSAVQIAKYHLENQLFVLPSRTDNSPNTLAEAMVSGLPVIATAVGGIPSMVKHGHTGWLVPPGNPVELAKAILQLLDDPELRARLGQAARQQARDRHRPERIAAQTAEAYQVIWKLEGSAHR